MRSQSLEGMWERCWGDVRTSRWGVKGGFSWEMPAAYFDGLHVEVEDPGSGIAADGCIAGVG